MCGIFGVFAPAGASGSLLAGFATVLRHRGPDGTGELIEGPIGLGMNRLAIIDREGGVQPMTTSDGQISIVYNGEIYNFRELRRELEPQIPFATRSDTEVILNGYAVWGDDVFRRLNGMFAIALFDRRSGALKLVRDPVGVKPLYLLARSDSLYFASEIKAFTAARLANTVDDTAAMQYLTADYVFRPQTAVAGVSQLEPGTVLEIRSPTDRRSYRYAFVIGDRSASSGAAGPAEIRAKLGEAVVRQTVADVPYGLLLSAGLDSMGILAALHRAGLTENLETFTAAYEGEGFPEHRRVEALAKAWGFRNTKVLVTAAGVGDSLDSIFRTFDNLDMMPNCAALHVLTQVAGHERRVLLAGNGGDELFMGYATYRATQLNHRLSGFTPLLNAVAPALARLPSGHRYLPLGERLYRFCAGAASDSRLAHVQWRRIVQERELVGLMGGRALPSAQIYAPQLNYFPDAERDTDGLIDACTVFDLRTWLVDSGLMMWDKAGMSASSEIRVPYLDLDFMRFMLGLSTASRGHPIGTKRMLRQALQGELPEEILGMPKQGFQAPVAEWLEGALGRRFEELSLSLPSDRFDRRIVETLWRRFRRGRRSLAMPLWSLGCLEGWRQANDLSWA
jgi:asparagine synthase (glutamine-hydrolysing)